MEFISQVIYVDNVEEVLDFYYQAFALNTNHISDDAEYGELVTGTVKISICHSPICPIVF